MTTLMLACALGSGAMSGAAQAANIAIDPGLEIVGVEGLAVNPSGSLLPPGWVGFTTGAGATVGTTEVNPFTGNFAGALSASQGDFSTSSTAVLKNANLGIGMVQPNSEVTVSFYARGTLTQNGVAFAEFFSEIEGGGTSSSEILGGTSLDLNSDPESWKFFSFTTMTGPDVDAGLTLQFAAIVPALSFATSQLFIDDIRVEIDMDQIPLPASGWLLAAAVGVLGWRRRRAG